MITSKIGLGLFSYIPFSALTLAAIEGFPVCRVPDCGEGILCPGKDLFEVQGLDGFPLL